jgi:hypothetical protein
MNGHCPVSKNDTGPREAPGLRIAIQNHQRGLKERQDEQDECMG